MKQTVTPNIKVRFPETSQHSVTARRRMSKEDQRIINCHENCKLIIMEDNDSRIFSPVHTIVGVPENYE